MVAQLRALGREPDRREFRGGHEAPDGIARWAFAVATGADVRAFEADDAGARP
jgi:hypothetical protein